ncbi:NAD(P)/FAD-dependent oxidoreductase [Terrarubrum flagellatum]|uniref:flavin monoamine oxidase family protein n=1 Tax=Terrirubrum flagellatum TaxID=2895980 RepID=UPI003144DA30
MAATRRTFLAGGLAVAATHRARAQSADFDVVIVGAGAAGFGAARALTKAGLRFAIIEARDRVGGRVFTDRSLGDPFDAGAQFIHWAERNPWRDVARDLGAETVEDRMGGGFRVYRGGRPIADDERRLRRSAFSTLSAELNAVDSNRPDISFAQLVADKAPELRQAAEGLSIFSLGDDPEFASVAEYAQLWAGDDLLLRDGYGSLVARALTPFQVSLATPATRVRWNGQGVIVETARGDLRAAAAIVTTSIGVLQSGAIKFDPALPAATTTALDGLRMGAMTKIALAFDGDRLGVSTGDDLFDIGAKPGDLFSTDAWSFDRNIMLAVVGGAFARGLAAQGEAAAVAYALDRVVEMLGADARKHFKGGRLAGWSADPFALGSYSLAKPGRLAAREALAKPIGDRIWIAGEATSSGGQMTAGGATLAGERAAREIAALLKGRRG